MCGRYTLTKGFQAIKDYFNISHSNICFKPRFNIAPSQSVPIIISEKNNLYLRAFRWGLIPHWSKNDSIGKNLINARVETLQTKPSFKYSFKSKRCLVPADGFYEWRGIGKHKTPQYVHLKGKILFAFAGLWAEWKKRGEVIRSFCIITTQANTVLKTIHDRMPVIMLPDQYKSWLELKGSKENLDALFNPLIEDEIVLKPVSRKINSPKNDSNEFLI